MATKMHPTYRDIALEVSGGRCERCGWDGQVGHIQPVGNPCHLRLARWGKWEGKILCGPCHGMLTGYRWRAQRSVQLYDHYQKRGDVKREKFFLFIRGKPMQDE